jgi:phosphotriesterase-related protein
MDRSKAAPGAEAILRFFVSQGLSAHKLVICHIDKRPDFGLHRELAAEGALLEYDTFFREKYDPERHLWPLLDRMLHSGLWGSLALATDLAEIAMWQVRGGPGLSALPGVIQLRLRGMGLEARTIQALLGGNINRRLARVV